MKKKLKKKDYEKELARLQTELTKMQEWVKHSGLKVAIICEGRDAAGKGGVIKRIKERVSPRVFRVVALPAPTERQKTQFYYQRYIEHMPAAGEIVIFDRSWYNRAGVERVMGFCSDREYEDFLRTCPRYEQALVDSGIQLVKYWFEVSKEEQTKRFLSRIEDPTKHWKFSPMDLESHRRWYDYARARDAMFAATDNAVSPWDVVKADIKRHARLNCIRHLLSKVPYSKIPFEAPKLPERQDADGYTEPMYDYRHVAEHYGA